jgi:hypothetical protein
MIFKHINIRREIDMIVKLIINDKFEIERFVRRKFDFKTLKF